MSIFAAAKTISMIDDLLSDLTRDAEFPCESITVQDGDDLPVDQVRVGDDYANAVCDSSHLLSALRRLPEDAPVGTLDAAPGSVWAAIRASEIKE